MNALKSVARTQRVNCILKLLLLLLKVNSLHRDLDQLHGPGVRTTVKAVSH